MSTTIETTTTTPPAPAVALRRGRTLLAGAMVLLLGLGAFASSDDGETTATPETIAYSTPETTVAVAAEESEGQSIEAMAVDGDLDAPLDRLDNEGVIDAAVIILSEGNLEEALASGRVSDLEVDTALLAIASGTLGDYAG
ncbi:MAG: hypothetical protein AAGD35_07335 [Actinomycetota bacterium]